MSLPNPVDHTASVVVDIASTWDANERFTLYRCDTCFALVLSEDAADHGQWHAEQSPA